MSCIPSWSKWCDKNSQSNCNISIFHQSEQIYRLTKNSYTSYKCSISVIFFSFSKSCLVYFTQSTSPHAMQHTFDTTRNTPLTWRARHMYNITQHTFDATRNTPYRSIVVLPHRAHMCCALQHNCAVPWSTTTYTARHREKTREKTHL